MNEEMIVLFSSCGRRVELLRGFRKALQARGGGTIIGCDINPLASALREADKAIIVPGCLESSFIPRMLEICTDERVSMIVPLIDTELSVYAANKGSFMESGTRLLVSDPEIIDICGDKLKTACFFEKAGLPFLRTRRLEDGAGRGDIALPAVLKPGRGSGGKDVYTVNDDEEVGVLRRRIEAPVLQEMARGQEVTVDCLIDFDGNPLRFVMRERLEIRAGESSKGRTFKDKKLMELLEHLFSCLKACGPITVQCFRNDGDYVFTEINPRFGGGYPLAQEAGANFPSILLSLLRGEEAERGLDLYTEDLFMSRYDQGFYYLKEQGQEVYEPVPED